jgi:hypothetical protein
LPARPVGNFVSKPDIYLLFAVWHGHGKRMDDDELNLSAGMHCAYSKQ